METITEDSTLEFYDLIQRNEETEIIVGNKELSAYVAIDSIGLDALKQFSKGLTVREVKTVLMKSHSLNGKDLFLKNFIQSFLDARLIKSVNGVDVGIKNTSSFSLKLPVSQRAAEFICSKKSMFLCTLCILAAILLLLLKQDIRPTFSDLLVSNRLLWFLIFIVTTEWFAAFFHEAGHVIAAKSIGIDSTLQLASRSYLTVAQTTVTDIWSVPRSQRYRVYFAGIIVDAFIISFSTFSIFFLENIGFPSNYIANKLLRALILLQTARISFQFMIFLKTDFYYVIANYFNCKNLYSEATTVLKKGYRSLLVNRKFIGDDIFSIDYIQIRQKLIVCIYSFLLIVGWLLLVIVLVRYLVPMVFNISESIISDILTSRKMAAFIIDKVLFLILIVMNFVIPIKDVLSIKANRSSAMITENI